MPHSSKTPNKVQFNKIEVVNKEKREKNQSCLDRLEKEKSVHRVVGSLTVRPILYSPTVMKNSV